MHEPALPALYRGIWREAKDPSPHRFKPEGIHGNLLPLKTNGIMTLCKRAHDGATILVHASNIEPIPNLRPRTTPSRAPTEPRARRTELREVINILEGLT